ncbi:MAG: prepilin peptidase [Candidatus Moranbacteria bacterium CG_4_9_14_3_um_filter_44_28]|nr:MAG: prepilin peptidase [Candidatus Moranbacteria bacterium CG17_big_fil_post_rev_8_21_14_2_50_44_12]PJA85986.1 MAG: prepilin peptidase [Candidatus Moranbacteria bacterium CG_4_9_14_3_um_filter_44_28]
MISIFFIVGLIVGSFLGVVNYRLKVAENIVFKRSHCPKCKKPIRWYDNIPLLSFIILAGQCRDCREKISWKYPAIELMTGLLFAAVAWKFLGGWGFAGNPEKIFSAGDAIEMAFWLFAVCYLTLIFFHDLSYMLIPDVAVYPAIVITLFYQYWKYLQGPLGIATLKNPFVSSLFAALIAALFFFALIWISRGKWIGGGDVKLGFLAGAIAGWPKILFVLFFAYMIGAIVSLVLIGLKKKTWKSQIPFGPFLVSGILIVMFFSEQIQFWANRYLNIGY